MGTCINCGSDRVHFEVYEDSTGVVAPDGVHEFRVQKGYKCDSCGAIEDSVDEVPEADS